MILRFNHKTTGNFGALMAIALLMVGVVGCAGGLAGIDKPAQSRMPLNKAINLSERQSPPARTAQPPADGSLWRENAPLLSMFADRKAHKVGDIITIKIVESSDATNKATTATDRASSLSASIDAFFNAEKRYPSDQPFFNPFSKLAGGLNSQFKGEGTTQRSGDLNASITALVTDVLPNGNLVVSGSREVLINNDNQIIELTGIVRPRDISPDNEVLSTYVADARISYSGTGVIDQRQKPGWLTNLVMKIWPF
jgi:flagellar L-ring protein precursor FlgH